MSLADELLADLEETEQEDLAALIKDELDSDNDAEDAIMADAEDAAAEEAVKDELGDLADGAAGASAMDIDVRVSSVRELCKLRDSKQLTTILQQIATYVANPRKASEMIGNVESDPEYQLIVEANGYAVEIDNEICKHRHAVGKTQWSINNFALNLPTQPSSTSSPRTNTRSASPSWTR